MMHAGNIFSRLEVFSETPQFDYQVNDPSYKCFKEKSRSGLLLRHPLVFDQLNFFSA